MLSNKVSMCSSAYHVIMIIACHRIRCTVCIFTYTIASYRITGESASSSARGTDRVRSTRNPGIGGARGRRARRGSTWVCGPPTQFLQTKQVLILWCALHEKYMSCMFCRKSLMPRSSAFIGWFLLFFIESKICIKHACDNCCIVFVYCVEYGKNTKSVVWYFS
jgi:hypothetical protein